MPRFRAPPDVANRIRQQTTWGGTSRSDRDGFLSSHDLAIRQGAPGGSGRREALLTGLIAVLIFSAVVIGCAVVWPSYLSCRHVQQTTGLVGGQTLTTCTAQRALWRVGLSI